MKIFESIISSRDINTDLQEVNPEEVRALNRKDIILTREELCE
jgi:hypothetical protein